MKNPTKTSEAWMSGVKLGIVRLGRAGGKMKYTLLDERDITLVQEFAFEARVEIDKNGSGANIYAFAYDVTRGRNCGQYVHDLLWERHYGGIALGFRVAHKNGITMDNRLENLCLVPQCYQGSLCAEVQAKREQTLYWAAIQELPPDHLVEEVFQHVLVKKHFTESGNPRRFNANGELIEEEEDVACYYECHYLPCTNIEQEPREFSICGRCQEARYCGPLCQQRDWPVHKKFCREKLRPVLRERPPER